MTYDGPLDIATGKSRRELNWKNKEVLWSALVKKISETHRTAETHTEYMTAKKPRQDEIKDIGGFVGGFLTGGRRKPGNVLHRQLITLDNDFSKADLWDDFTLMYDCAAALYSTHKHTPDRPRQRILIPLSRPVFADEYMAIARKIASVLGIDNFDHTTFQPYRLMYWPSTSKDGVYQFEQQDGPWLDADEVLGSYTDWTDSSSWPVSDRETAGIKRGILKQGDPLEKPGIIGAFCRTFTIHEAISNFLTDQYEECAVEGRYTYKTGSTAAGLVTYDDKFSYSHHGTDPTSGKLCNAFDLVRLHLFGIRDEDARDGTRVNDLPSFKAMQDFAMSDSRVKAQRSQELIAAAREDFAEFVEPVEMEGHDGGAPEPEPEDESWTSLLEIDRRGNFLSTIDNIYLMLKNDPKLKNALYLDEFEGRLIVKRNLPWRVVTNSTRDFSDDDADCLAHYLERRRMPFVHIQKALAKIRSEVRFHPVRDYLTAQKWDGVQRLDSLFIDYLGSDNSAYVRSVTRKTLVAAVARVFQPGVKFDTILTFVGKEGIGKSTIIAKLAGKWFSDCLGDIHTKEGMESLRGVWIMEIAELASFRKADQEAIKRFITSLEDIYRPAYGRQLVRFLRQCIFVATTNTWDFLIGSNGNRRFLPVDTHVTRPTKDIFRDLTQSEVDQVWAEALTYYKAGESLNLDDEINQVAALNREAHQEIDDRQGIIEDYLNTLLPDNWRDMGIGSRRDYLAGLDVINEETVGTTERKYVCVAEIWCEVFNGLQKDMTRNNTRYIHDILKKSREWRPLKTTKRFGVYGVQKGYERIGKTSTEMRVDGTGFLVKNSVTKE